VGLPALVLLGALGSQGLASASAASGPFGKSCGYVNGPHYDIPITSQTGNVAVGKSYEVRAAGMSCVTALRWGARLASEQVSSGRAPAGPSGYACHTPLQIMPKSELRGVTTWWGICLRKGGTTVGFSWGPKGTSLAGDD
jgi:hypothetical protein